MNAVLTESSLDKLTDNERRVYDYLVENKSIIDTLKIKDISERTYTSAASVIRTAKKLGFKGYKELLYYLINQENSSECGLENLFYVKNKHLLDEFFEMLGTKQILFHSEGLGISIVNYI